MTGDHYKSIAPHYEKIFGRFLYPLRQNICTYISYRKHKKIIDMCCGTGKQLEMLYSHGMELHGVDLSEEMIGEADKSLNINYINDNASEIEIEDNSFDCAILTFSLHEKNAFDRSVILKKCWQIIRPNGNLVVADFCQQPESLLSILVSKLCINAVEKMAGREHYNNYTDWIASGALEGTLLQIEGPKDILSYHFFNTVMVCTLTKKIDNSPVFHIF